MTSVRSVVLLLAAAISPLAAQSSVRYEIRFPNAVHHEAQIRATFLGVRGGVLEAVMSRSSPGRYALHEFAKNVYSVRATDVNGKALRVTQRDPYQWNIETTGGAGWSAATQLAPGSSGTWTAPKLDALMDAPLEIGPHLLREWSAGDARFRMALHFNGPEDVADRFQHMSEAVVLEEAGVFGGF